MSQRLNYFRASPVSARKYQEFSQALDDRPVVRELHDLVTIRASQLNGCAFCLDMHVKQAKLHGERDLRVHHIAVWRESNLFNPRERAALAWTEVLTRIPAHGVEDDVYQEVRAQFSEEELADLTLLVVGINGWNRLNVAFRTVPGSADEAFGLDKAGLA
jgi:AhpD family alkylhydroperoxidase